MSQKLGDVEFLPAHRSLFLLIKIMIDDKWVYDDDNDDDDDDNDVVDDDDDNNETSLADAQLFPQLQLQTLSVPQFPR